MFYVEYVLISYLIQNILCIEKCIDYELIIIQYVYKQNSYMNI